MSEAISGTSVRGYGEPHRRPVILPEPDEVGKPALPATVTGGCDLGYAWRTVGEAYRDAV